MSSHRVGPSEYPHVADRRRRTRIRNPGWAFSIAIFAILAGYAMTSGVMEAEGGTYLISARAAPIRGGAAGANAVAHKEAQKFCATKGKRAVIVTAQERDVYQSSAGASWSASGGFAGGGIFAAGNANLRFRCSSEPAS
jgi:hypothetical protein